METKNIRVFFFSLQCEGRFKVYYPHLVFRFSLCEDKRYISFSNFSVVPELPGLTFGCIARSCVCVHVMRVSV